MTKTYTTVSGDEWDSICYKVFGEGAEMHMDKVMKENPDYIHLVVFPAGITLNMPELNLVKESENKPPWMK